MLVMASGRSAHFFLIKLVGTSMLQHYILSSRRSTAISTFTFVDRANTRVFRAIIQGRYQSEVIKLSRSLKANTRNVNMRKMQQVYQSCMNETRLEELGQEPLQDILRAFNQILPLNATEGTISRHELTNTLIWLANMVSDRSLISRSQ
jgi:predicted metalloendopeptidase